MSCNAVVALGAANTSLGRHLVDARQPQRPAAGRSSPMAPFSTTFDPSKTRSFARVPRQFNSPEAYLDVMKHNVEAELVATVRQARPSDLRGVIRQISGEDGFDAWTELEGYTGGTLSKTLLCLQMGGATVCTWHIVRRHQQPSDEPNDVSHQIQIQGLPTDYQKGQQVCFKAYGYIGDAVRTSYASPATAVASLT